LNTSDILRDSYNKATLTYEPVAGTFNGFNPNNAPIGRIDHIFLTNDFSVLKYGILDDTYRVANKEDGKKVELKVVEKQKQEARCPSDHFPVMITVEVK